MTHKYKHYIDLKQFDKKPCPRRCGEAMFPTYVCYQCAEQEDIPLDNILTYARELEERNKQLDAALRRIIDHGMPSEFDTTQTWLRCSMSVYRIARDAWEHGGTHETDKFHEAKRS